MNQMQFQIYWFSQITEKDLCRHRYRTSDFDRHMIGPREPHGQRYLSQMKELGFCHRSEPTVLNRQRTGSSKALFGTQQYTQTEE